MSHTLTLTCPHCGHTFERTYGVNVVGQATLYCNKCGKSHFVDFSLGWEPLPDCECGGSFDPDAKGCCPQCGEKLALNFRSPRIQQLSHYVRQFNTSTNFSQLSSLITVPNQ